MTQTYSLVCHSKKLSVKIGQRWTELNLWHADKNVMMAMEKFLRLTIGENIVLIIDDLDNRNDDGTECWTYKEIE